MDVVFGPIISRRFGISLGVDLSPHKKQCNFDCVYCELNPAKPVESFSEIVPLEYLLSEVKAALAQSPKIDVLTITANGEPTLYPHLRDFIINIKPFIPLHTKSLILSNGSRFGEMAVQEALRHFDMVKFSLDSIEWKSFKKVDRPHKSLDMPSILEGIKRYAKTRENMLICEILIVKNYNDSVESLRDLAGFLREIGVDRIDLSTIDRPPAYKVEAISSEEIARIGNLFAPLCVAYPHRDSRKRVHLSLSSDEILALIQRRPIDINEARNMFDEASLGRIDGLVRENRVRVKKIGLIEFYVI